MKLRELRENRGMFREELAKAIGTTARTIGCWEMVSLICPYKQR